MSSIDSGTVRYEGYLGKGQNKKKRTRKWMERRENKRRRKRGY